MPYTATTKSIKELREDVHNEFVEGEYSRMAISEAILKAQADISKLFGTAQKEIIGLRKELTVAAPEVVRLGGSFKDVIDLQKGVSEGLQTNTILFGDTTAQLFAAGKVFGKIPVEMGKAVVDFEKIGISADVLGDKLNIAANQARRIGVNTAAVYTQISQNLDKLNQYGFQNGIEGLTRMATKSAALRIDMREMAYFAEKVYTPEGAIETVAALQRMGAAVGDLADPFKLMYMAQEDMEGLLNSISKMSDKFAYFDEQSKEFKIFPNAKRDLREISMALGINQDTINTIIMGQAKLQKMGGEIRLQNITEEDRLLISSLATMDKTTGKYQVKVEGGQQKMVSELNSKDLEFLQRQPKTMEDIAREQLTAQETLVALFTSQGMTLRSLELGGKLPDQYAELLKAGANTLSDFTKITTSPKGIRSGIDNTDFILSEMASLFKQVVGNTISQSEVTDKIKNLVTGQEKLFQDLLTKINAFEFQTQFNSYVSSSNNLVNTIAEAAVTFNDFVKETNEVLIKPLKKQLEDLNNIRDSKDLEKFTDQFKPNKTAYNNNQSDPQIFLSAFTDKEKPQNLSTTLTSNNIEQRNTQLFSGTQNTINQNQNNPVLSTISYLANIERKTPEVGTRPTDINVNNKNEVNGQIALVLSYNGNEIKIDDMTVNQIIKNPEFISYVKGQINDSKPKSQFDALPNYAQT